MKKVNKGFVFYFGILLGVLVASFLVCVLILIFSPGTSVFGIKYYKEAKSSTFSKMSVYSSKVENDVKSYEFKEDAVFTNYEIKKITVESNLHEISVIKASSATKDPNSFLVTIGNKTTGFSKEEDISSTMSVNYYEDTKTLEIVAKIPTGFWTTSNNSSIYIQFPKEYDQTENIELSIDSGEGSVTYGDVKTSSNLTPTTLAMKSVSVKGAFFETTNWGKIGSDSATGNCTFELSKGMTVLTKINANTLTLKTTGGNVNIKAGEDSDAIIAGMITIESENTTSSYGNITALGLQMKNIYGTQTFKKLKVSELLGGSISISGESRRCNYNFEKLEGNIFVGEAAISTTPEKKADECNFVITENTGTIDILTTGNVTIKTTVSSVEDYTLSLVSGELYKKEITLSGVKYTLSYNKENGVEEYKVESALGGKVFKQYEEGATVGLFDQTLDGIQFKIEFTSSTKWHVQATRSSK